MMFWPYRCVLLYGMVNMMNSKRMVCLQNAVWQRWQEAKVSSDLIWSRSTILIESQHQPFLQPIAGMRATLYQMIRRRCFQVYHFRPVNDDCKGLQSHLLHLSSAYLPAHLLERVGGRFESPDACAFSAIATCLSGRMHYTSSPQLSTRRCCLV